MDNNQEDKKLRYIELAMKILTVFAILSLGFQIYQQGNRISALENSNGTPMRSTGLYTVEWGGR